MRVKPKQKIQVLKNSDRSAEVLRIRSDVVTFKVFFEVDPTELIDSKVNFCEFKVFDDKKMITSKVKTRALSSSIALQKATTRKVAAKDSQNQIIADGVVDLTKSIPNDRIAAIAAGQVARRRKRLVFTDESDVNALRLVSSEPVKETPRDAADVKSSYKAIFDRKMRDPASDINAAEFHSPTINAARGTRVTSSTSRFDPKMQAFRSSFEKSSTSVSKSVLEDEELSTIEVEFLVSLRKAQIREYTVEVTARAPSVVGLFGRPLQTIKLKVDFQRIYENHIVPTLAPTLQFTTVGTQRLMRIKQVDSNSTSVAVFRKSIQAPAGPGGRQYKKIASIPLKFGQETQIFDRPGQLGKSIYRVIPYNELLVTSGEFSSAVAMGSPLVRKRSEPDETTILAYESDGGVKITVFNIPNEVISIRLLRKSITTYERTFTIPTTVKDGAIRSFKRLTSEIRMLDKPARPNTVYEYKVMLVDSYGEERESLKSCVIHFSGDARDQEGYTFTTTAPQTSNSSVTFQVDAPTNQASLDLIYGLLNEQGLYSQYENEINNNKQLLSKLTALEILRFDTVTGVNESFGVVKTGIFRDDATTQKAANVSPLTQGRRYIYQYRLLIRSPSTIFNESFVSKTDLETGKSYTVNQKKFSSPKSIKSGTLASNVKQIQTITKSGLKFDASSSSNAEMIAGRTALTGQFEITIPFSDSSISNVTVESTPRGNVVRWSINEGLQKIDHFIIYAEYNGKRAPLRALHFDGNTKMIYLDDKLKASTDEVSYYVQIVFDDFSQGQYVGPAMESVNAS